MREKDKDFVEGVERKDLKHEKQKLIAMKNAGRRLNWTIEEEVFYSSIDDRIKLIDDLLRMKKG